MAMSMNPLPLSFIFITVLLLAASASTSIATLKTSPSPSPAPAPSPWSATALTRSSGVSPAPAPTNGSVPVKGKCFRWCKDNGNLSACLGSSQTDPEEAFLLVKNDGGCSLRVNFTISEAKTTVPVRQIEIPKNSSKKVNVSAIVGGSRSILLTAGHGYCVIHLGSSVSDAPIFGRSTPFYLLFFSALIVGFTLALACRKSRTSRHQGDGVSYHELEIEKPDSLSVDDVETKQGWDAAWGETQEEAVAVAVQSLAAPQLRNVSANGSKSSDRENNWSD